MEEFNFWFLKKSNVYSNVIKHRLYRSKDVLQFPFCCKVCSRNCDILSSSIII